MSGFFKENFFGGRMGDRMAPEEVDNKKLYEVLGVD